MKTFSKPFRLFVFLTLLMVYLVFVAGSLVRISGSGMGCPDWPKCFGQWIPPGSESELPHDYQEKYLEMRIKKVNKFSKLLQALGMDETASQLLNDPGIYQEEQFNKRKTWTEYLNRFTGFMAGNFMLFQFLLFLFYYKNRKMIWWSLLNLVLIALTGWLGSVVVASNLTPWTITLHMLLGVSIILLQCYILYYVRPKKQIEMSGSLKAALIFCFLVTLYQIFLGTQVREQIDLLSIKGLDRDSWAENLGIPYFIHRSFSWLVLVVIIIIAYINEKKRKITAIRWIFAILALTLISGVTLAHFQMPAIVQTIHLISATVLLGIMFTLLLYRSKNLTLGST